MRKIEIYAINYDHPNRQRIGPIFGGISKEFVCGLDDKWCKDTIYHLETYADMRAPYWIWKNRDDLDIIGFHGYRKFLDFRTRSVPPQWWTISLLEFRAYQKWLAAYDGASPNPGVAGRFALAVPLAETLAAGWVLARAPALTCRRAPRHTGPGPPA